MPHRRPIEERFWEKVAPPNLNGCRLWTAALNQHGYGKIGMNGKSELAHRVSWTLANGPIPDGMKILHRCDTPACVNVEHLFVGTQADNMEDMFAKRRGQHVVPRDNRGARNPMATLTDEQVLQIRSLRGELSQKKIGEMFGVHQSHVCKIHKGQRR